MPTSHSNGSQTAVIDTEHQIALITTDGTFLIAFDTNAMVLIDVVTFRINLKVRSTGTTRLVYEGTYKHVQGEKVKLSIPVPSTNEIEFTLEQTAGTGRAFPWEIWEL